MNMPVDLLIVGYGRFGRALLGLGRSAGLCCRAVDLRDDVPEDDAASEDDIRSAKFVALATPVPSIGESARTIRERLSATAIVFDVGSVKVLPRQQLADAFGDEVAWVPTHPLFGPASLARGERPLRVVVCREDTPHTKAAMAVAELFETLGCEVIELGVHAHDRKMARTHALAFFVARGVLDIGVDIDEPLAPPSFQAMATTVRTVREDAGHLFEVLQSLNPYAAEMREEYMRALEALHSEIRPPE
jgi:prephenate dehydrogenase